MENMKDSEYLTAAQDLIRDPETWIKSAWCKLPGQVHTNWLDGEPVRTNHTVTRMCIDGALMVACGIRDKNGLATAVIPPFYAYNNICEVLGKIATEMAVDGRYWSALAYNDYALTTHDDVMALMDKGRAMLEEQGK